MFTWVQTRVCIIFPSFSPLNSFVRYARTVLTISDRNSFAKHIQPPSTEEEVKCKLHENIYYRCRIS